MSSTNTTNANIVTNLCNFYNDISTDGKDFIEKAKKINKHSFNFSSLKKYTFAFINLSQKVAQEAAFHYPNSFAIALLVTTVSSMIFFSFSSIFIIGLNFCIGMKYGDPILNGMKKQSIFSEWAEDPTAKKGKVTTQKVIYGTTNVLQQAKNILTNSLATASEAIESITNRIFGF